MCGMTLSLAWVRTVGRSRELVMASDSRLRFGCAWDCCPKLMMMPRTDIAVSFSGDTQYAYPLMLQMSAAIGHYSKSKSRVMDLYDLKGYTVKMFNHLRDLITDLPKGQKYADPPETKFILGGYSWRRKKFAIWLIHFDASNRKFTFRPCHAWPGSMKRKLLCMTGDHLDEAKGLIIDKLKKRNKLPQGGFDMEPFEVLRDMIRSGKFPEIGGAPQILKVQEHMNCTPYSVYWPDRESNAISLLGRPLFDYEFSESMILDPDTLEIFGRDSASVKMVRQPHP
jgi:hypothetical protein